MKDLMSRYLASCAITSVLLLSACGGGGTVSSLATPPSSGSSGGSNAGSSASSPPGNTAVLISLGEYAAVPDPILSLELTIETVTIQSSKGDVPLLSSPHRLELSRFKAEPLVLANVVQGNYSGIVISVSNPVISFIESGGVLHEHVAAALTSSTTTNNSSFTIDSAPSMINLNPAFGSLGGGSVPTMTLGLYFSTVWNPPFKDLVGRITDVGDSQLTIDLGNRDLAFSTDSNTKFHDIAAFNDLTAGMTVEVDAVQSSDGTLRATEVKLEQSVASELVVEGLVLSTAPAQFPMLVREVHGPVGVPMLGVGKVLAISANASTQFHLEPDHVDLNNLDFTPTFNALTIAPAQSVRSSAASGSATAITADQVKLEEQSLNGIAGTVTAGAVSGQFSFPLKLTADSAFAKLTGQTSVLVTLQPSTQKFLYFGLEDCVTCITDGEVRVRGLLFFSGGQYRLVAEWAAVI